MQTGNEEKVDAISHVLTPEVTTATRHLFSDSICNYKYFSARDLLLNLWQSGCYHKKHKMTSVPLIIWFH